MKRVVTIAGALVLGLLLPILAMGFFLTLAGDQPSPSERALEEIPSELIPLYQAAAETCEGLEWTVLAAIHKVETGFGTGDATSSKGAQGPMQFMPSTWTAYATDGDGDGRARINDVEDAVFSAATLLCANGAGDPARLADAIWNYNHSEEYVNEVLVLATNYGVYSLPGGMALASSTDVLRNPRVVLTPQARLDLRNVVVDPRLVSLIAWVSERHTIAISVFKSGHAMYVSGTDSVSNHFYGRAADISTVDGVAVSEGNAAAKLLVLELAGLGSSLRPTEIGHPFGPIEVPGGFSDGDHRDHLHVGFDS
jgi:hypothetical protein